MRDNIIHHQMHTLDSPSVITFSTERPRMLASWSFIAQNAPTESCRCTTRIPWYHQNPAYTHRILFALTACNGVIKPPLKEVVGGILVSVHRSVPHAVSALWLVAYFMDYIHMWHKYNPWGDDVSRTFSRSIGQRSRSRGSFKFLWSGQGIS